MAARIGMPRLAGSRSPEAVMLICPTCNALYKDRQPRCARCGASLLGIDEAANADAVRRWRDRQRLRGHLLTGVLLCFGLPTLFGLPGSLLPGALLGNLLFGVLFGVPLAWGVSRFAGSTLGGAAVGCVVGFAYCLATFLCAGAPVTMATVLMGIGTGLLPGAIMGMHVGMDR